ncbi:hypothetical protein [uncultured Hydrogenophaga sp.]|uniref:hypothetical protein n=1 Tax=uncultured Hydrogenophaga sp. TaxID=199683 RepID=UPI00258CC036|nr:hypothetical protein [uncultured Hydrogenophaga sp.]
MPNKVGQANQTPIALNQPFARHSRQEYQWVPPLEPRTPFQRIKHAASSLGTRIVDVLRPNSPRASDRVGGLKAADKEMVKLLAHVLDGATDVPTLAGTIQQFSASAHHVFHADKDENVTLAGLMDTRAKVHIEHMSLQDLQTLATRLDKAIEASATSDSKDSLQVLGALTGIHRQVVREQASRAVLDACKAVLRAAPQGTKAVTEQFDQALRAAGRALITLGMPQDGSEAAKSRPHALVKEILNDLLERGSLPRESMRALFKALPSATQSKLLASDKNKKPMFNDTGSVDALLKDTIAQQWRDLKQAVADHCEAVGTTNPSADLPRFSDHVTRLARQWPALQEHTAQHKLPGDRPLEDQVSQAFAQLTRLQPEQLQAQLGRLTPEQLVDFSTALESLGISNGCLGLLTAAIGKGEGESLATPGNYLLEACNHLSLGQTPTALDWLAHTIDATPAALKTHAAFGNSQWKKGAEGYTAFQDHLIKSALDRLDEKELKRLHTSLSAPRFAELASLLQQIGFTLEDMPDPKGDRIRKMGMALETLITELDRRVKSTSTEPTDDQPLDEATFEALSKLTGVRVFPSGEMGVVYDAPKAAFQRNLDAMLAKPAPGFTPVGQKGSSGVSEAMYVDLKRSNYVIEYPNDYSEPLFGNTEAFRIDQLRTNAELSADELLLLSQVAHQGLWAGVIAPQTSPQDSPIRLPDGTPVNLVGQPKTTFTVRRGPEGRLFVRCEQELSPVLALDPATGNTTALDMVKSGAWFGVELEIGKGQVQVSKPLTCSYALVPAAA